MNITSHRSTTTHPPDTGDPQVLHIPDPAELRELRLADRLSFRIGLWLLERAQAERTAPAVSPALHDGLVLRERPLTPHESHARLAYHLQQQLR
ncbi:hypothetical protein [Microbacterium sp. XT11]|uniref:hypothetical protein n=1 Tax=Microbacterium sp. XT11 TaxID=367477 RepID=UPI00082EF493|nr:hypothetical protein [Microbacterium sp. XT11]